MFPSRKDATGQFSFKTSAVVVLPAGRQVNGRMFPCQEKKN